MRVTNQIMMNNSLANIDTNKNKLMEIEERYNTGKKIQRPSDDPIVAIRALKLRNSLAEISQYYKKNVPDAKSWLQTTESALRNITDICTSLKHLANQGSQDTLTAADRKSIMLTMQQYREQIYSEGNASYAGRYVFTGYKTDSSLTFMKKTSDKRYTINEEFKSSDIKTTLKTYGNYSVEDYQEGGSNDFSKAPENKEINTLRLAYRKLDKSDDGYPKLVYTDKDGNEQELDISSTGTNASGDEEELTSKSYNAYEKPETGAKYLADTGELVLSDEAAAALKGATGIKAVYRKTEFEKGDVKPEHYFECDAHPLDADGEPVDDEEQIVHYKKEDQDISYEVSYNQRLKINTQAKDAITTELGRELDGILSSVEDVVACEDKIAKVEKLLKETEDGDDKKNLEALKNQLSTELTLKKKVMQERFSASLNNIEKYQDNVNKSIADLGSREARLNLTESRLSDYNDDFTELMSNNEDANLAETIVRFNSQQTIYNASLAATAKVVQNSLLDFLR